MYQEALPFPEQRQSSYMRGGVRLILERQFYRNLIIPEYLCWLSSHRQGHQTCRCWKIWCRPDSSELRFLQPWEDCVDARVNQSSVVHGAQTRLIESNRSSDSNGLSTVKSRRLRSEDNSETLRDSRQMCIVEDRIGVLKSHDGPD
jgi:hypothetical protein